MMAIEKHQSVSINKKSAIVLSGHTIALGVVRALGTMGVPVVVVHYDERDIAHLSKYVTAKILAPHPERFEDEFVDVLLNMADCLGGGVLFPVSDESLVVASRHKQRLSLHYAVACPEWEITRLFIEKKYSYRLAEKAGLPTPKTIIPRSVKDIEEYGKNIEFPWLVKPSQSHLFYAYFKRKMFSVEGIGEMLAVYQQASDAGLEVMLQEIIPGHDMNVVNYNAYFWEGQPLVENTAEHIRNAPPWFGSPRVALSKLVPEIIEPGRKILRAMGFYGYACTEFKRDERDGVYKFMEVNGRHNLSTLLSVRCGINFPWLQYKHLVECEVPSHSDFQADVYWIDVARDLGYSAKYFTEERYSLLQYIRPYLRPHVFAILDLKDFLPFIKRIFFLARKAFQTLLRAA